jgi:hypothetical protein
VGYECDGAPLDAFDAAMAPCCRPGPTKAARRTSYQLLAAAPLGPGWQELPPREGYGTGEGIHAACMGVYRRGGTVFTAGTTDWAQVLGSGQEPCVDIITANVIKHLMEGRAGGPAGVA